MAERDLSRGTRLYVPNPDSPLRKVIAAGSAIVGHPVDAGVAGERIEIYYEGGIYNQVNVRTFDEKVMHAWDRCVTRYPTAACAVPDAGELIEVGHIDVVGMAFPAPEAVIDDQATLDAWLNEGAKC